MFVLGSDITIGGFRFSGVHSVRIERSIHSIVHKAVIQLPARARVHTKGQADTDTVITASKFATGDRVRIRLGYNGDLATEFEGFVQAIGSDRPLTVTCEGPSWLLGTNRISGFYKSISLSGLLDKAVSGLKDGHKLTVRCDAKIMFVNIRLDNSTGTAIIKMIHDLTDGALTCYFNVKGELWCGMIANGSQPGQTAAAYRPGYNTTGSNELAARSNGKVKTIVEYRKRLSSGTVIMHTTGSTGDTVRKKILGSIGNAASLKLLAMEKAAMLNYSGYAGSITTLLQPRAYAGDRVMLENAGNEAHNGNYLVESELITYSTKGARRKLELGMQTRTEHE